MKLYGIHDRAAGMYVDRMLVLPADASATRIFFEACSDSRSELAKYPTDFELVYLGEFDSETGVITPEVRIIARGVKPEVTDGS